MGKRLDKQKLAFQALIDSVCDAPLAHIRPCGYIYVGDDGMAYAERRPDADHVVAVFAFDALQQAFSVGRSMRHAEEFEREKSRQRGIHEYNSWRKNISADRKRRRATHPEQKESAGNED